MYGRPPAVYTGGNKSSPPLASGSTRLPPEASYGHSASSSSYSSQKKGSSSLFNKGYKPLGRLVDVRTFSEADHRSTLNGGSSDFGGRSAAKHAASSSSSSDDEEGSSSSSSSSSSKRHPHERKRHHRGSRISSSDERRRKSFVQELLAESRAQAAAAAASKSDHKHRPQHKESSSASQKQPQATSQGNAPHAARNKNDNAKSMEWLDLSQVETPQSWVMIGGKRSGKSTILFNILSALSERFDVVFVFSENAGTRSAMATAVHEQCIVEEWDEKLIAAIMRIAGELREKYQLFFQICMFFDDYVTSDDKAKKPIWGDVFKRAHHNGITAMFATHAITDLPPSARASIGVVGICFTKNLKLRLAAYETYFKSVLGKDQYMRTYERVVRQKGDCLLMVDGPEGHKLHYFRSRRVETLQPFTLGHPDFFLLMHMFGIGKRRANASNGSKETPTYAKAMARIDNDEDYRDDDDDDDDGKGGYGDENGGGNSSKHRGGNDNGGWGEEDEVVVRSDAVAIAVAKAKKAGKVMTEEEMDQIEPALVIKPPPQGVWN